MDQLELQFYETQLELYDAKFEILKNEEQLLVAQIDTLRRQIKGKCLQCIYLKEGVNINSHRRTDGKHYSNIKQFAIKTLD